MEQTFYCDYCHEDHPVSQREIFDGQEICYTCLDTHTVVCQDCGQCVWSDENDGTQYHPLCSRCYEWNYTHCSRCGMLLRESRACYANDDDDDEYPYCSSCYNHLASRSIRDYYYKPDPVFYGEGPRFYGVELEIDGAGEDDDNARSILNICNADQEQIYCKHDGSLDEGFEIVTHPMSLAWHQQNMLWKGILDKAIHMGYQSHQARTCGLHIHVSRAAFGRTAAEQDAVIARILYFFEKHWEELLKFSRRTQRQMERWAARYGYKDRPQDILDHAKYNHSAGRYSCVNLQNCDTIEFRMFRGTLKLNTLIATLQLVDRVCDVALFMSDDELKNMSWTTFAAGCTQPELVQYLKERRLYVNEPVEVSEEV